MTDDLYRTPIETLERVMRRYKRRLLVETAELEQLERQRRDTVAALDDFIGEVEADRDRTAELVDDYKRAIKRLRGRTNANA